MTNSDTGSSNSNVGDGQADDFDDMEKTAVLDDSSGIEKHVVKGSDGADDDAAIDADQTVVLDDADMITDNIGDVSVEINVEELIADIEANSDKDAARKLEIRRRLEEAVEDRSFEDTYAIDLDEQSD